MNTDGRILGYNRTDGSYFPVVGIESAMRFVISAAENVLNKTGVDKTDINMIVAGITGIDWHDSGGMVINELKKHFGDMEIIVCNDCEIAYFGGSFNSIGAVLCAGTGMNAAFFAPGGKKLVLGDYLKASVQGATAISTRSIEAVFDSDLGMVPETKLTPLFFDFTKTNNIHDLMEKYITSGFLSEKIARLVPKIIEIAEDGDEVAKDVLDSFSDDLCAIFIAAMKKMGMQDLSYDVVLAGSVFSGHENCLTLMCAEKISRRATNVNIVNAIYEPVVGACIKGIIEKTGGVDARTVQAVTDSAKRFDLLRQAPALRGESWLV
jgi:N-acetylglucosamine kinase-like BadF-type ATPase